VPVIVVLRIGLRSTECRVRIIPNQRRSLNPEDPSTDSNGDHQFEGDE